MIFKNSLDCGQVIELLYHMFNSRERFTNNEYHALYIAKEILGIIDKDFWYWSNITCEGNHKPCKDNHCSWDDGVCFSHNFYVGMKNMKRFTNFRMANV